MKRLIVAMLLSASLLVTPVYAGTGMYSEDANGNIYLSETGWVEVNGNLYYSHKTKSRMYKAHEVCRNEFRWKGNKLYYFDNKGRAIKKNTKYITLHKDGSVDKVFTVGTNHCECWDADELSYQRLTKKCRWKNVGHQTNLWLKCDWQE